MWLMIMFDLPVETKENRRDYRHFVENIVDDGYIRIQFSVYGRPCMTEENTAVHQARVINWIPPAGEVRILKFTDKQWERMTVFRAQKLNTTERSPKQFMFFDEDGLALIDEEPIDESLSSEVIRDLESPTLPTVQSKIFTAKPPPAKRTTTKKPRSQKQDHPAFDFFD